MPWFILSTLYCPTCRQTLSLSRQSQVVVGVRSAHYSLPSWRSDTHYSVLGVRHDATQEEIRSAYLKKSKELHPDTNMGKTQAQNDEIHNKFVKVNAAYSVLGNKKERRMYDLEVLMKSDPRWQEKDGVEGNSPHMFRTKTMTFEERAQAFGFKPQDPNFYAKHGNYHHKIVVGCIIFIVVGIVVQGFAIMRLYKRHTAELDLATHNNTMLLMNARANARNYSTVQEQYDSLHLQQHVHKKASSLSEGSRTIKFPEPDETKDLAEA